MSVSGPHPFHEHAVTPQGQWTWYREGSGYKQKPVTATPLPYYMVEVSRGTDGGMPQSDVRSSYCTYYRSIGNFNVEEGRAYARAFDRLRSNILPDSASLGMTIASWRESLDMVSGRCNQISGLYRALRDGDISAQRNIQLRAKVMGRLPRKPPAITRAKRSGRSLSGSILEWNFGWAPLLQDINDAISVLASPPPGWTARASASEVLDRVVLTGDTYNRVGLSGKVTVRLRCDVRIVNPYVLSLNQLGLLNPASIAFDKIPLSFLLNWALPVQQFLESFTAFAGLELSDVSRTYFWKMSDWARNIYVPSQIKATSATILDRRVGPLPIPGLYLKKLNGLSPRQGINSLALVTQLWSKLPNP